MYVCIYTFENTLLSGILATTIIINVYFTYPNNSRLLVKNEEKLKDGNLPIGGFKCIYICLFKFKMD